MSKNASLHCEGYQKFGMFWRLTTGTPAKFTIVNLAKISRWIQRQSDSKLRNFEITWIYINKAIFATFATNGIVVIVDKATNSMKG